MGDGGGVGKQTAHVTQAAIAGICHVSQGKGSSVDHAGVASRGGKGLAAASGSRAAMNTAPGDRAHLGRGGRDVPQGCGTWVYPGSEQQACPGAMVGAASRRLGATTSKQGSAAAGRPETDAGARATGAAAAVGTFSRGESGGDFHVCSAHGQMGRAHVGACPRLGDILNPQDHSTSRGLRKGLGSLARPPSVQKDAGS